MESKATKGGVPRLDAVWRSSLYEQRLGLLHFLLQRYQDDTLKQGALASGANLFPLGLGPLLDYGKSGVTNI